MKKKEIFITVCIVAFFIIVYLIYLLLATFMDAPLAFKVILFLIVAYFWYTLIKVGIERIEEIKEEDKDDYSKY